jgi:hypothetical protein
VLCVGFSDEIVGFIPGHDDRYRSGDKVCAVVKAEKVGFAQGLEVFLYVREQTFTVSLEIEEQDQGLLSVRIENASRR